MAESTPMPVPDPQQMLDALHRRFVAGLGERWSQIAQTDDPDLRRQALHRLAGAAGSYGLDVIGRRARSTLELIDTQPSASVSRTQPLSQALADLHAAIQQAQAGPQPDSAQP